MNYLIRPYTHKDFEMIASWWTMQGESAPIFGMMVEDGTFVLEIDGIPALTQTVLLTQSKELCYLEGFCKNPEFKKISLECYVPLLWDQVFSYAKNKGYKRILGYCKVDKLKNKYKRLGLIQVMDNLSGFTKEF